MTDTSDSGAKKPSRTEKKAALNKAHYQKNAEKLKSRRRERWNQRSEEQIARDKMYKLQSHLRRTYNIDLCDYEQLLQQQGGKCALCFIPAEQARFGRLDVDHDHETGKIRGLLCNKCNRALGMLGDSKSAIVAAAKYIKSEK